MAFDSLLQNQRQTGTEREKKFIRDEITKSMVHLVDVFEWEAHRAVECMQLEVDMQLYRVNMLHVVSKEEDAELVEVVTGMQDDVVMFHVDVEEVEVVDVSMNHETIDYQV